MWRDLLSTIRDSRTIRATIIMPMIFIPLFTLGLPLLMGNLFGSQQQARQQVGVVGDLPQALRDALGRDEKLPNGTVVRAGVNLVPVTDPVKAVQDGKVEAVVKAVSPIPTAAGNDAGTLEVYAKLNSTRAQAGAYGKIDEVVKAYNRSLTLTRLKELGLNDRALTPVTLKPIDASPPQEQRSGVLAFLIPMLMLQFILAGGMATAIDATAGEKERGTLESLLVAPVRRAEVVTGKLLATTLTALVSATFGVIGFVLSGLLSAVLRRNQTGLASEMSQVMGGQLTLDAGGTLALLGMATSAALVISALLIAVAIYARSFKEAQTYIAPLNIAIVIPAVMLQFADFLTLSAGLFSIPLVGSMLAILELVKGNVNPTHALLSMVSNVVAAILLSLLALRSFGREEVIFRN